MPRSEPPSASPSRAPAPAPVQLSSRPPGPVATCQRVNRSTTEADDFTSECALIPPVCQPWHIQGELVTLAPCVQDKRHIAAQRSRFRQACTSRPSCPIARLNADRISPNRREYHIVVLGAGGVGKSCLTGEHDPALTTATAVERNSPTSTLHLLDLWHAVGFSG